MNNNTMQALIDQCTYKPGWRVLFSTSTGRPFIQLHVTNGTNSVTGKPTAWRSGKRYLSPYMCRQEIIGSVFGLIKDAELHEVHEWFRYKGASIFNPHLDPDALAELASQKQSFNMRLNAMSMQEDSQYD